MHLAVSERALLAASSTAALRILEARPSYARFLTRAPRVGALARVPLDNARVRRAVRLMRARTFVHSAWQERNGASPLAMARLWSDVADACITLCARMATRELDKKLGPAPMGRAIFGLGKLGSRELNPSSDVDLLVVYERDGALASGSSAHEWHVSFARRVRGLLHDVDDDGFAFRVDYDLRPEGTAGPLANSVDALESYYERFGQTWERAALLRLRPVFQEGGVGAVVERRLRPFVFPRNVDERAVDELFAMKQRVTSSADEADGAFDVKRGRGGIREVEFVAQSLQLLHGGKIAELRVGDTVTTLARLEERGLLAHKSVADLTSAYVDLRRLEHALQYGEDRQTQTLPAHGDERKRVRWFLARHAAFTAARYAVDGDGDGDSESESESESESDDAHFRAGLAALRERVHASFERLLGEGRDLPSADATRALDRALDDDARISALHALGFADAARALQLVRVLERRRGSPLDPEVLKNAAAQNAAAHLLDHVAKSPDAMTALARLPDLFFERVPRAALLRIADDRRTLALATRLLATSAPLSRLLARHHGLLELLSRHAVPPRLHRRDIAEELRAESAVRARDVDDAGEARLIAMRSVHGRRTLEVALSFFAGRVAMPSASLALSTLADALLDEAHAFAMAKLSARHGSVAGLRFGVVALGSLGGREIGFFRDVDLLFVYDAPVGAESDGARSIGAGEYAARAAQQVIWALAAPLAEGACYAVDPRLRPSGSQGVLTTSLATFIDYHARSSAPWEKQSLLRARLVAGDRGLGQQAMAAAKRAAFSGAPAHLGQRLLDMRARMVAERAARQGLDLKMGEGGLADVEFAVQGLQMVRGEKDASVWCPSTRRGLRHLTRKGHVSVDVGARLSGAYEQLLRAREALALVDDKREPSVNRSDPRLDLLARAGVLDGKSGAEVYDALAAASATIRELTWRILARL